MCILYYILVCINIYKYLYINLHMYNYIYLIGVCSSLISRFNIDVCQCKASVNPFPLHSMFSVYEVPKDSGTLKHYETTLLTLCADTDLFLPQSVFKVGLPVGQVNLLVFKLALLAFKVGLLVFKVGLLVSLPGRIRGGSETFLKDP